MTGDEIGPLNVRDLKQVAEDLRLIANFEPWRTDKYPGCGSSEYSQSGYKSFLAERALKRLEAWLEREG